MTLTKPPIEYRSDWGALPPKSNPGGFKSFNATVCHYTAANRGYAVPETADHEKCRGQVRGIQRQHQAITNQSDIEYNALTCLHGVLLEGRVPGYKGGANGTAETNATMPSICCLLGVGDEPNPKMLNAVAWFHSRVEETTGKLLVMKKHMEIVSTSCPGVPMSKLVDAKFYRALIDVKPEPPKPVPKPKPPPLGEDGTVIVIAAPVGTNARFLATSDGKGFISNMTWIPNEEAMARLAPHFKVMELEVGATKNIGLVGPIPHGDSLKDWSEKDFLNAYVLP